MSTNRVLFSAGGLKIAKPGFDVLGAIVDSQVSFDSAWAKAQRILLRGKQTIASGTLTVSYGRTLAAVPTALILWKLTSASAWASVGNIFNNGLYANAADLSGQTLMRFAYTDRLELPAMGASTDYSYIVLVP